MSGTMSAFGEMVGNNLRAKGEGYGVDAMRDILDDKTDFIQDSYDTRQDDVTDAYAPYQTQGANNLDEWGNFQYNTPDSYQANEFNYDFEADPAYEFQRAAGEKSLAAQAAQNGSMNDSGYAKDLVDYNQDYANTAYANAYDRARGDFEYDETAARAQNNVEGSWDINNQTSQYGQLTDTVDLAAQSSGNEQNLLNNNYNNFETDMQGIYDDDANLSYQAQVGPWDRFGGTFEDVANVGQQAGDSYVAGKSSGKTGEKSKTVGSSWSSLFK